MSRSLQNWNRKKSDGGHGRFAAKAEPALANISKEPEHLRSQFMNQKEERYTQWVRATYPYVDAFRARSCKMFEE